MKKAFLVFMVTIFIGINVYSQTVDRDSQWDFFKNVIPKQKSITFSGGSVSYSHDPRWTMTINDKYNVSFYCEQTTQNMTFSYRGNGFVIWDTDKMKITLTINASVNYNGPQHWMDGNRTFTPTIDFNAEYLNGNMTGKLNISSYDLRVYITGSSHNIQKSFQDTRGIRIGGSYTGVFTQKSESELNASTNDEFGEWNWNTDRTRLFLKSQSSDNKFVILIDGGKITWCMEMVKGSKGLSDSTTDKGEKIINLAMAFDGTSAQNISFIENTERTPVQNFIQLDFVVYNRFMGTLEKNPDTVLNQLKEKQMLILTYTVNGGQRTDMFMLEGLSTILDYLKK